MVGDIGCLHHGLLCWRVCLASAIVGCPDPPDKREKDGPGSGEDMVCGKEVGKVESLSRVLLWAGERESSGREGGARL